MHISKIYNKHIFLIILLIISGSYPLLAQRQKIKNQPYADQKIFHLGFTVGINAQDLIINHTGAVTDNNEVWFSEIPSYSVGFSVGLITDRYINQYMNLRAVPTLYFGEKRFTFREQSAVDDSKDEIFPIKTNYLSLPIHMRFSSERLNNIRPYVLAGGYISSEVGRKSEPIIKFKNIDYGLEFGLGCNLYFPFFKLSPELRFSFGLRDLVEHNRSDLSDPRYLKFTEAIKSGKSRMITLTFNFE